MVFRASAHEYFSLSCNEDRFGLHQELGGRYSVGL
jgi:hypothetical protein